VAKRNQSKPSVETELPPEHTETTEQPPAENADGELIAEMQIALDEALAAAVISDEIAKRAMDDVREAAEHIEKLEAHIEKLEESRSVDIVPSIHELAAEGFTEEEAAKLVAIVEAAKLRAEQPLKPVVIVSKPGLKITSRQPKEYWCAGHALSPGRSWEPALDTLSEAQLVEIDHKRTGPKATIIVEEVMVDVEVEVEIDDEE
jgi:hypothetical protein